MREFVLVEVVYKWLTFCDIGESSQESVSGE